jgi:hypothetical protein
MGLAKTAEQPKKETPQEPTPALSEAMGTIEWAGVPVDLFRFFNVDLGTTPQDDIKELKDIYDWAKLKCDEPTIGNILQKISSLETQLGSPNLGEKRFSKMWVWVKMSKQIDDLDKRREALRKRWL